MAWGWRNKQAECIGSVLFRGSVRPRAEEFAHLKKYGITMTAMAKRPDAHWGLELSHPKMGESTLVCLREVPRPPRDWIMYDPNLAPEEKELALLGESTVTLHMEGRRKDVLRDRKAMLRLLRAVMDKEGLFAIDHQAMKLWSRAALDDELMHTADLDVEALYTLHAVTDDSQEQSGGGDEDEGPRVNWLHTHGLAQIGLFDFDILKPSQDILERGRDSVRAIAFAILEEKVQKDMPKFELAQPGGHVRLVEVGSFIKRGPPWANALRTGPAEDHNHDRTILCEPEGFVGRMMGKVRPSVFLSRPAPDEMIVHFSPEVGKLMAERARGTYKLFRKLVEEFAEFEFTNIVKLGYEVDGGGEDDLEHMWFEAHELRDDKIDATLGNDPFNIAGMKKGDRKWHDVERLTDWTIITPFGMLTPRYTTPARFLRVHKEEILAKLRAYKAQEAGGSGAGAGAIPLEE